MNWLAHLYLSAPDPACRLGSLLPDLLSPGELTRFPPEVQHGIALHQRIDAFTDGHPIVRERIRRIEPPFRRFGGVLLDLFFDHLLARDWQRYSDIDLPRFAREVYAGFAAFDPLLPPAVRAGLARMAADDFLCSYRESAGIAAALERIGARLRRPVALAGAMAILERDGGALEADFREFFPQLCAHLKCVQR